MVLNKWPYLASLFFAGVLAAEDYNILNRDGSFEFGYDTPDSYHKAQGNRNNIVRGQFGGRNPGTGAIDTVDYTAGPRGFRPRGKNVVRKYDFSQVGPRPIGSKDDPYFDPSEDPSYNFAFRTRTYQRDESANRVGDVNGRYSYIDDVGETHNVEFIAGKNTGFHVKTPFPDSNPRAYGPLFFNGRGKPIPRGRTAIQRGLDGSYRFISAGPDQRRTETSDSAGNVRGSYTYLDPKGVQHSVHYIAGPEIGYRVLKNVKGPHIPSVYPFNRPEIVSPDFYTDDDKGDVFHTAASGHVRPTKPPGFSSTARPSKDDDSFDGDTGFSSGFDDNIASSRPDFGGSSTTTSRPFGSRPTRPFGGSTPGFGSSNKPGKPTKTPTTDKPNGRPSSNTTIRPSFESNDNKEGNQNKGNGDKPSINADENGNALDEGTFDKDSDVNFGGGDSRPSTTKPTEGGGGSRPFSKPSYDDDDGGDVGDLFGDIGGPTSTYRPSGGFGGGSSSTGGSSGGKGSGYDDGSYKPSGEDGTYRPPGTSTQRPPTSIGFNSDESEENGHDIGSDEMFGTTSRPSSQRPGGSKRPGSSFRPTKRPGSSRPGKPTQRPKPRPRPTYEDDFGSNDLNDDFGLFGGSSTRPPTSNRPGSGGIHIGIAPAEDQFGNPLPPPSGGPFSFTTTTTSRPGGRPTTRPSTGSSFRPTTRPGSYKPTRPGQSRPTTFKPGGRPTYSGRPGVTTNRPTTIGTKPFSDGSFGGRPSTFGPSVTISPESSSPGSCGLCNQSKFGGTIVTNVGDKDFLVPPGVSVRAHVQAIDLLPLDFKVPSPSEQYIADTILSDRKDTSSSSSNIISTSTETPKSTTLSTN